MSLSGGESCSDSDVLGRSEGLGPPPSRTPGPRSLVPEAEEEQRKRQAWADWSVLAVLKRQACGS